MNLKEKRRSPPIKVLSSQLREGKEHIGPNGKMVCTMNRLGVEPGRSAPLEVSVAWMQGTVLDVNSENGALVLDETGTFSVLGVDSVPRGKTSLSPGRYVMVMGILKACNPEPVLRAVKIADLSENITHRKMWKFEVEDLQQTLG
ncbi:OB DNA-binding domain-containing protein C16orf175-like [Scleropages formosus]|uniref:OB DNA-binding domain-containing protein C16orf175-like n=1 Tax=Scleropages formosus TaxID=113540 RepID=A0A0P7U116_SCLFO|nr:recQ-mediated genome instability protein 2 [Scleropages formosus]KPP64018.1 OB DNA-binding domain-containing protein C16orf175-like [Scleropages formosus]